MADVMEEYQSSLEDLTFNSKPHINMLTILAEENKGHAENIVRLIEAQIVKATEKLPLLYLLDSIIKNVGENYKPLFARNLSSIFKRSFQAADDKSKMSMYKLRTTWDNYFPLKKLHALDMTIKALDSNWPVKPLPAHLDNAATNIHVNPKFIKKNEPGAVAIPSISNAGSATSSKSSSHDVDKIRQQLMRQQKELLDLQQKKLILELEQTKQELAVKTREAQKSTKKIQEKVQKDPRNQSSLGGIGGLRVTLSNNKASPINNQSASTPKDPRIKQASAVLKKETLSVAKPDASKANVKKKTVATPVKKDKSVSPKISPSKNKLLALSNQRPDAVKTNEPVHKKTKERIVDNKSVPAVDSKKQKRLNRSKSPSSNPTPPKIPRMSGVVDQSSERRKKSKEPIEKSEQYKNQRINKIKFESKDSSRSSESSLSPRFSPEPESDDHLQPDIPPPPLPFLKRNDGLRRRPSFDPDLHIPKELTLSHQHEILKQADHQLQTGQLTHRQHQELLKQLHQLFEVQRMKKLQAADERHHDQGRLPLDPRQTRRNRAEKMPSDKREMPRPSDDQSLPLQNDQSRHKKPFKRVRDSKRRSPDGPLNQRDPNQFRRSHPPDESLPPNRRQPLHRPPGPSPGPRLPGPRLPGPRLPGPHLPGPHPLGPNQARKPVPKNQRRPSEAPRDKRGMPYPGRGGSIENRPRGNRRPDSSPGELERRLPNRVTSSRGRPSERKPPPNYPIKDNNKTTDQQISNPPNASDIGDIEPPPRPPLSPPPFFRKHSSSTPSESDGGLSGENLSEQEQHKSLRQYALSDSTQSKEETQSRSSGPKPSSSLPVDEKAGPEEPEDFIIANMPVEASEEPKQLEEPEDYIIAGMQEGSDEKKSCEEPEDYIIAQMPPGAEAYHNHSMGLKRNSDSEKAYLDHIKKIKQSIYSNELKKSRRKSSQSDSASMTDESASEKPTSDLSKKEEIRSPSLPPKKRKYFETESSKTKETKEEKQSIKDDKGDTKEENLEKSASKVIEEEKKKEEKKEETKTKENTEKSTEKSEKAKDKIDKTAKSIEEVKPKPKDKPSLQQDSSSSKVQNKKLRSKEQEHAKKGVEKRPRKDVTEKRYPTNNDDTSSVYVIEDEDEEQEKTKPEKSLEPRPPRRPMKRPFPPSVHSSDDWRRKMTFEEEEEARIQKMMQEEQEKLEWEHNLTRKLKMEQWKEDQMRRDHRLRGGRGRARIRFPPPGRWKSPPRDAREPESFDIARGKIFHRVKNLPRSRLRRPEDEPPHPPPPPPRLRHPFPPEDDLRIHRHRPPSPGAIHPPGWDPRRPRTPPGRRFPPPFHDPHEDRLDWERHQGRVPPRDLPFHPDERHRSPPPIESRSTSMSLQPRRPPNDPPTVPAINQVNVNKLLTDLVTMGIIPGNKKPEPDSSSPAPAPQVPDVSVLPPPEPSQTTSPPAGKDGESARSVSPFIEEDLMVLDPDAEVPVININSDLKVRHDEIIKRIYTGIQCSACGLRFTTRQTDLYADHLDWHYRLNRKDKEGSSLTHRELYPTAGDWICFEEIENPQERAKNSFFEELDNPDNMQKVDEEYTVPLTGKSGEDICKVCKEAFETFYNENDDEWQFANCLKVDDDNFHPSCYGDYQDQLTPSTPLLSPTSEDPKVELSVKEEGNLIPPASCEVKTNSEIADNPPTEPMDTVILADAEKSSSSSNTAETRETDSARDAGEDIAAQGATESVKPAENLEVTSASVVTGAAQPELSVAADASSEVTELATEAKQEVPLNNNESETEAKPQDSDDLQPPEEDSVEKLPPTSSEGRDEMASMGDCVIVDKSNTPEL